VWALAQQYFDGSVLQNPLTVAIRPLDVARCEVRCDTLRGFFYKLQSTPDLTQPFADDPAGFTRALDSSLVRTDLIAVAKFYRAIRASSP
jgi:hypothetical protein